MNEPTPLPEYSHIAKAIHRVAMAPHGQKRALESTLKRKRLASLKREIRAHNLGRKGR